MCSVRFAAVAPLAVSLLAALALTACATPEQAAPASMGDTAIEGTVVAIDTVPWTYDGHAVVDVDTGDRGHVAVQLPAR